MTAPDELVALVIKITTTARDFTPRRSVELGVLHGLCLDAARKHEPHLVEFVASVPGLKRFQGYFHSSRTSFLRTILTAQCGPLCD